MVESKQREKSGPTEAGRVVIKYGESKWTVPLRGGTLTMVAAIMIKAWATFTQMQEDVEGLKDSFEKIVVSVETMADTATEASNKNTKDIVRLQSEFQASKVEADKQDAKIKALQRCAMEPKKRCEL